MTVHHRRSLLSAAALALAAVLGAGSAATAGAQPTTQPATPPTTKAGAAFAGTVLGGAFASMYPVDVTTTSAYYYVVDPGRYRIERVVRATGKIDKTTPGGGKGSGDGELAAARALAVDTAGAVYVADTPNHRIVKYDPTLQTVLAKWGTKGTAPGQFTNAYGVALGPGLDKSGATTEVVYTIDSDRVQVFSKTGEFIRVFAGGFNQPRQIEVNKTNGEVYVVNARAREIVAFSKAGTRVFSFGSEGSALGQFKGDPRGVTASRDGKIIFVTDDGNRRVQAFSATGANRGKALYAIGSPTTNTFVDARGIEVTPDGKLLVADEWDYSLKEFNVTTSGATLARRLFGVTAPKTGANSPRGIALDSGGRIFVSDWWNQRIVRRVLPAGAITTWGKRGIRGEAGTLNFQWAVAVQPGTNNVFVANRESHEIKVFNNTGTKELFVWGKRTANPGDFTFPQGMTFAPDGTLWVADSGNGRIQQFRVEVANKKVTFLKTLGSKGTGVGQFDMPTGISVAQDGTIWVADTKNSRIQSYKNGAWGTPISKPTGTATKAFNTPWGVTAAPDGSIWVADTSNKRLVQMSNAGVFRQQVTGASAGTTDFLGPFQVIFSGASTAYMSDTWGNRVIKLNVS